MNENDITDKRNIKEFKGITFSKYKKSAVKKYFYKYILIYSYTINRILLIISLLTAT